MNWKSELKIVEFGIVAFGIVAKRAIIPQVAKFDNRPAPEHLAVLPIQ